MSKPNKNDIKVIRAIAKKYKIRGCKMMAHSVEVGKQCQRLNSEIVVKFIADLKEVGFIAHTLEGFIEKGLVDTLAVCKYKV